MKDEINSYTHIIHLIGIYNKHLRSTAIIRKHFPIDTLFHEQAMYKRRYKKDECKQEPKGISILMGLMNM